MSVGNSPRFRRAQDSDVDAVVALVESAYRGDSARAGWTHEADLLGGQRTDQTAVRAMISGVRSLMLLGVDAEDTLVACCQLERRSTHAYFGTFAVSPLVQSHGIGDALLRHAQAWAYRRWASTTMELTVVDKRPELIAWYERRGYQQTGESRPFPYDDARFGRPTRPDLSFAVLTRPLP